jgi:hypothetical protein
MVKEMKEFVIRLLVAAVLTFAALALSSSAQGQNAEDQSKAASLEQQPKSSCRFAIRSNTIHIGTAIAIR